MGRRRSFQPPANIPCAAHVSAALPARTDTLPHGAVCQALGTAMSHRGVGPDCQIPHSTTMTDNGGAGPRSRRSVPWFRTTWPGLYGRVECSRPPQPPATSSRSLKPPISPYNPGAERCAAAHGGVSLSAEDPRCLSVKPSRVSYNVSVAVLGGICKRWPRNCSPYFSIRRGATMRRGLAPCAA
jgi:hypothetical protein